MSSLAKQEQLFKVEWDKICNTKSLDQIGVFFNNHKDDILASGSGWFLFKLIKNQDIQSIKYIFQHSNPQKYINKPLTVNNNPMWWVCHHGTFEMIRLMIANGAQFPAQRGNGIIYAVLSNTAIEANDMYLCVDYILSNLTGELNSGNIIYSLTCHKTIDAVKMGKLIKTKQPVFTNVFDSSIWRVVDLEKFDFAQWMVDNGAKLSPDVFTMCGRNRGLNNAKVQWLLNHGVDVNGFTRNQITPLFDLCIARNYYKQMELLLKYGADINKICSYQQKQITPLQYIKDTFADKFVEYFTNFSCKQKENVLLVGVDFQNIPNTAFPLNFLFDEESLNQVHVEYTKKNMEINDLEKKLNKKYSELREIYARKTQIDDEKANIEQWKLSKNSWNQFLNRWRKWNVDCFVEYLKRMQYTVKSYREYFKSDDLCKSQIENYVKQNMGQFELCESKENECFCGTVLVKFDANSIREIGIGEKGDIDVVCESLRNLTESDNATINKEQKLQKEKNINSEVDNLKHWLNNVVKLPQYIDVFVAQNITLEVLPDVSKHDLQQIGVVTLGHQLKLLKYAKIIGVNDTEGTKPTNYI
eukprot:949497_1